MNWRERIMVDPNILDGKPIVKGTRLSVQYVIDLLGRGWSQAQIPREFAHVRSTFPLVPDPVKLAAQDAYRDVERGLIR